MKDIVIIDDEKDVLDIVKAVLNTKGYRIRVALGGKNGLEELRFKAPDLIICDLMMPGVSGRQVIKEVKESETLRDIPFITLSAMGADTNRPEQFWAQGLGVDEFIMKPFDPMDLLGRVEALLRRNTYGTQNARPSVTEGLAKQPGATNPALSPEALPIDVAKTYLLAWNSCDWKLEYDLTAEEITANFTFEDYKNARLRSFSEERGNSVSVAKTSGPEVNGQMASITYDKTIENNGKKNLSSVRVDLRKTTKGWRVLRVKTL